MDCQQIIVLTTQSLSLHSNLNEKENVKIVEIDVAKDIKFFITSNDKQFLIWAKSHAIGIKRLTTYDGIDNLSDITFYPLSNVQFAKFSPNGNCVWFWRSIISDSDTSNNFHVFSLDKNSRENSLTEVYSSVIRGFTNCEMFWSQDETKSVQFSLNSLRIFTHDPQPFSKNENVNIPGLIRGSARFPFVVMCVDPSNLDCPSFMKLFKFPHVTSNCLASQAYRNKKDFMFYWNKKGNIVLITCTNKDEGKSLTYYGTQELHLLSYKGESLQIEMENNDILFDVNWFPISDKFVLIHGVNPCKVSIFNAKGDKINQLNSGSFNRFFFDPFESFICLSGIGSVKGHTEIHHLGENKTITLMNTPPATDFIWLPDGFHFVFASLSPKMNLDNGYLIYDYLGNSVGSFSLTSNSISTPNVNLLSIEPISSQPFIHPPIIEIPSESIDLRTSIKSTAYVPTLGRSSMREIPKVVPVKMKKGNKKKVAQKS